MYWPSKNQLNKSWSKSVNKVVVPAFHQFTTKPGCFECWFARNSLKSNRFLENTWDDYRIWFRTFLNFFMDRSRHILVFCGSRFPAVFTSSSLYAFQDRWFFSLHHCSTHQLRSSSLSGLFRIPLDIIVLLTLLSLLSLPPNLHVTGQLFFPHLIILLVVFDARPWVWC